MTRLIVCTTILVLLLMATLPYAGMADDERFSFACQVLDRYGKPVPNAMIGFVAVNDRGRSYGPAYTWSAGWYTGADGVCTGGMGTMPELKPGKVQITASHPSIEELRQIVNWSDLIQQTQKPTATHPLLKLQAKGGPGLEAWRQSTLKEAPALVKALLEAKDAKEVESVTDRLAAGEMQSIPSLVTALHDYGNPHRRRLVDALMATWGGCRGVGQIDLEAKTFAMAVFSANAYVRVLRIKPRSEPSFLNRRDRATLDELDWVIDQLQSQIADAQEKGNSNEVVTLREILAKMEGYRTHMRANTPATGPSSHPSSSSDPSSP